MVEIDKKAKGGLARDVWECLVGTGLPGGGCHVQVYAWRRETRPSIRSNVWTPVAYWSACSGPSCPVPSGPRGVPAPPPERVPTLPRIPDAEVLRAVMAKTKVCWSGPPAPVVREP